MIIMPENYIYLHHLDKFYILPTYPESISDSMSASFTSATPLLRSSPILTYTHSGPRTLNINLNLHRDLMSAFNNQNPTTNLEIGEDYIDVLVKELQAIILPRYSSSKKMVDPPMVTIRFGNSIYIKGVIQGSLTTVLTGPILEDNRYAVINLGFAVTEIDPYDAETVQKVGQFRGLNRTLERRNFKVGN